MIRITDDIYIDEKDLQETFVRSGGPGGQHVNKVSTAVQLRFDVEASVLPQYVKERILASGGGRMTEGGVLIIVSRESRSRQANREVALEKLIGVIRAASHKPKKRLKTRPSMASKEKRIVEKKTRSKVKKQRVKVRRDD